MYYNGVCAKEYKDVALEGGRNALAGLIMHAQGIFSSRFIRDWVFQQKMSRVPVADVKLLKAFWPHVLPWPCNLPDFNLVENLWSVVQYRVNHEEEWHQLESFREASVRSERVLH
jgi:hypothetical protein